MHLLPLLALTAALLSGWLTPWPTAHWAFWENVLPIALVFLNSVAYHTCQAHHQSYRQWLLFDVRSRTSAFALPICTCPIRRSV